MAVWADVDGKSIQITCPQDFESVVPPGVYPAIIEFFGCEPIGTDNYEKRIERAENSLDNLRWEYEHLEDKNRDLDNENDDLRADVERLEEKQFSEQDMEYICDKLCKFPHLAEDEEKLHEICERCRMARKLEDD